MALQERSATDAVVEARERYVAAGVATPPLVVARAEGARIEDVDGRTYIDFAGGLGCQNTGHGLPAAVAAIHEQVDRYLHQCFMVGMYEPYVEVCRRLAELSPCRGDEQKSLLLNSGAEAVENAVKIARVATGRPAVVVFDRAFHGRTLLAMTMTSKVVPYKRGFGPVRARGLPRSGAVSVPRRLDRRRDRTGSRRCSRATWIPSRSPASCSSRCRARAGSSRCRATSPRVCASCATATGSSTSTTRCRAASAAPARSWAIEHYGVEPDLARLRQVARRRAPARRRHRAQRGRRRGRPRRPRRDVRGEPGRLRGGGRGPGRGRHRDLPAARARAGRADPRGARRHRLPRRRRGRGARARAHAGARAGRGPRDEGAGGRPRRARPSPRRASAGSCFSPAASTET